MDEDDKAPPEYKLRLRIHELLESALEDGTVKGEDWDPYILGYTVLGGDLLLQEDPALVADIVGYACGGSGVTEDDLSVITGGMESRMYAESSWGLRSVVAK